MFSSSRPMIARLLTLVWLIAATACTGGESCGGAEESDETPDTARAPDAAAEADTRAEDLAEARDDARSAADELSFQRNQQARLVASEIEGARGADKEAASDAPPRAEQAPPGDDGEIDVEAVQKLFENERGALQTCYERALKQNSSLQGKVTLSVRVGTDGSPAMVQAKSNAITDRSTLACMEREAKSWQFPRPKGGTVMLNKPFRFSPNQ